MGIVRGGDAEYEEFEPSYKEKADKLETIIKQLLQEKPDSLKLSGKYIATDEINIIGNYSLMKSVSSLDLSDKQKNILPMAGLWSSFLSKDNETILSYTIIKSRHCSKIEHNMYNG